MLQLACAVSALCLGPMPGKADTASVVTAADALLTTSQAQTSPYSLTPGYEVSQPYSRSNDEKWTDQPGSPPKDTVRIGPVIGGGPSSYNSYELSDTVSSGQTDSPRAAALTLANTALSTGGYGTFDEIRNADDVLRATGNLAYNYGDYRVAILGTPSTSDAWMLMFSGHHLTYNITYNAPFVSASPMSLGTEPPDYFSIGPDLTSTQQTVVYGTDNPSSGGGGGPPAVEAVTPDDAAPTAATPEESFVSNPFNANATTTPYSTANVSKVLTGATAITGATDTTLILPFVTSDDNGFYYCVVTNSVSSSRSHAAAVTVATQANANLRNSTVSTGTPPGPIITAQPVSQTVAPGDSVTLTVGADGTPSYQWYKIATAHRAPLEAERAAVSALATAVQADGTLAASALLPGTFTDVVLGATANGDTNFPFINTVPTYPTGTVGRGALIGSMTADQQAAIIPLVETMMEAWVTNASDDIANSLLTDYESGPALAQTYVGYQVGAGAADGTGVIRCNFDSTIDQELTPANSQNSYLRIDGPRVWIEMVVQDAVVFAKYGFVQYQSIYRDKLADYGNEFGGYLDTTNTDTSYTRPSFTMQPTSVTGASATFTATATANTAGMAVTPEYQWYDSSGPILGATSNTYTTNAPDSYFVTASTAYGTEVSDVVTFNSTATSAPAITTQPASLSVAIGQSATFSVAASGSDPLSYQWYKNNTSIPGATSDTYTVAVATAADAGSYAVVVTNSLGSVTSNAATLTVTGSPTVPEVNVAAGLSGEVVEGGAKGHFVITRTGVNTGTALTVHYKLKGSAANGTRYVGTDGAPLSGTAVIPAGDTKLKLKIKAVNDSDHEGTEKIKLVLKAPGDTSYSVGAKYKAVLRLIDND